MAGGKADLRRMAESSWSSALPGAGRRGHSFSRLRCDRQKWRENEAGKRRLPLAHAREPLRSPLRSPCLHRHRSLPRRLTRHRACGLGGRGFWLGLPASTGHLPRGCPPGLEGARHGSVAPSAIRTGYLCATTWLPRGAAPGGRRGTASAWLCSHSSSGLRRKLCRALGWPSRRRPAGPRPIPPRTRPHTP